MVDEETRNRRVIATETRKMRSVIDALLADPTPTAKIMRLIAGCNRPATPVFERYAGMVLRDAGCGKLADIPPARSVLLSPPGNGRLARIYTAQEPAPEERIALECAESAVNRLCDMVDAIEDSADFGDEERTRAIHLSIYGSERVTERPSYRSANVMLPEIRLAEKPTLSYLNEVDWRMLDHVAVTSKTVFQQCMTPNRYQSVMGAFAPGGSDWDIRTRMANVLSSLELSIHVEPRFDCDAANGTVSVCFETAPREAFPRYRRDDGGSGIVACSDQDIDRARRAYTIRLACLLAAACFGAGRQVRRAYITAERRRERGGEVVLSCAFDRDSFARETLPSIEAGHISSADLRFDPQTVLNRIAPSDFAVQSPSDAQTSALDDGMRANRIPVHLDTRDMTDAMQELFRAKRICDIATRPVQEKFSGDLAEAQHDSQSSAISALARLESIIESIEAETTPPDDDASARPLYCSKPSARAAITLLDDELGVSSQAEAYLNADTASRSPRRSLMRFFRAPSSLFEARIGLSHLYEHLGDLDGAGRQADLCIALAPTTARAYQRKADILAQEGRFIEAANVLVWGLRAMASPADAALLYYHLALLFWKLDRKRDAAAVLVYTTALSGEYATKALSAVRAIRKRESGPVIASASPLAAAREMAQAHIPIAPSDAAKTLIVQAAIGLACADAPEAAAPYAAEMATWFRDDEVIAAAARSLVHGTSRLRSATDIPAYGSSGPARP